MQRSAIVLFAHGARDAEWAQPFQRIEALVRAALPEVGVQLAFLELMTPDLVNAVQRLVDGGATRLSVVPLFMAQGGHLKHDVPKLLERIRAAHPGLHLSMTPAIGDVDQLLQRIAEWIVAQHRADAT